MVEIVSTRQVGPCDKLEYWNDIIGSTYRGMVVDTPSSDFDAQLSVWQLGPVRMVRPRSSSAIVRRHESRSTIGFERLTIAHIVNTGQIGLTQRGRFASLGCGDMVLCSAEEYYRFDCMTAHELTVVEFDGDALATSLPGVNDRLATKISGQSCGSRIFQRFLSSLWQEAETPLGHDLAQAQASVLVDLLGACLDDGATEPRKAEDLNLRRIREVIADRLGDFDLGPTMIAKDTGIPLRTLQGAAARHGTTIGQMITEYRLMRGAAMLNADPRKSVIDIALECGFADPSYFARRFAQRFGISPRRYRIAH